MTDSAVQMDLPNQTQCKLCSKQSQQRGTKAFKCFVSSQLILIHLKWKSLIGAGHPEVLIFNCRTRASLKRRKDGVCTALLAKDMT